MNKKLVYILFFLLYTVSVFAQSYNGPESVIFDPQQNRYLISNANNGVILQRSSTGVLSNFATGLNSPKGMVIVGTTLYVTDVTRIKAYSLATGQQLLNRPISGSSFLNDITYDGNRYLYFTDMNADKIFRMDILNQSFFPFISSGINAPNGIYYDASYQRLLLVSFRSNAPIQSVNIGNQQLSTLLSTNLSNLDGITMDDSGDVYISSWGSNAIYKVDRSFNQSPVKIDSNFNGPADIYFNTYSKLLAIPDMNNNNVVFHNLLDPHIIIQGNNEVCEGQSTALEVYQGLGLTFEWYRNDTFIGGGNSAVADLPGYFTVRVSNLGGTSVSDTAWIIMRPRPSKPGIYVGGNTEFCLGDSIILSGPSGYLYQWSTGAETRAIFVKETKNYALVVKNGYGCSSVPSDNVSIKVYPDIHDPVITPLGPNSFCEGDSVTLQAYTGYKLAWSTGDSSYRIVVNESKNIYLQLEDTNNCKSNLSKPMVVTAFPNPVKPDITINGNSVLCEGDSVQLAAPLNYDVYQWNGISSGRTLLVFATDSFSLRVIDTNNCISPFSDTVGITVNPLPPVPSISNSGNMEFCEGDSVIFSGPDGFKQYMWSNNSNSRSITIRNSDTLRLRVMNDFNCVSKFSDSIITRRFELPAKPEIKVTGDTVLCAGDVVTLSGPPLMKKYLWNVPDTSMSIEVDTTAAISLSVLDMHSCESPVSDTVYISYYPKPEKPEISKLNDDSLICNISGVEYEWFYEGGSLPFLTQAIHQVGEGEYTVVVSNDRCTSDTSDVFIFKIGGFDDLSQWIQIYPNPAQNYLYIEMKRDMLPAVLTLINTEGKVLLQKDLLIKDTRISLDETMKGLLLIRISYADQLLIQKILVQ